MSKFALSKARASYDKSAWVEACEAFAIAESGAELAAGDLDCWATAAYLAGRDEESTAAWSHAFDAHLAADEPELAVISAFWSAFGLFQRGEMARGGGWVATGYRLVDEHALDCVGVGYLAVPAGLMALGSGDVEQARQHFERSLTIAERFDDSDLRAMARLGIGQAKWAGGEAGDGAQSFDEVMLSVTRGRVSPVVAGIVYCAVIDGCQRAFDVERASEWTRALNRWCDSQPQLVSYRGQCLVHRSQVLQMHGDIAAAVADAEAAVRWLADPPRPAIGMAYYQLGELARLRGDFSAAEREYRRAQEHGRSPQPGVALVHLHRGEIDLAVAAADTAVAGARDQIVLVECLPAAVEILIAAGKVERARQASERLRRMADREDSAYLAALTVHATGLVYFAMGDALGAMAPLRAACEQWRRLETPYQEGRARVAVALACRTLGDAESAALESETARQTFAQIGAVVGLRWIDSLFEPAAEQRLDGVLSPREIQVLRRVSIGRTNKQIAEDLFISVKTVERHLSNIFVKLDASNRAAATAIAGESGLL